MTGAALPTEKNETMTPQKHKTMAPSEKDVTDGCSWATLLFNTIHILQPFEGIGLNVLLVLLLPYGWLFQVLLFTWIYFDRVAYTGEGRSRKWLREADFWKHLRLYHLASRKQEVKLDPDQNYLFIIHPHGIIGISVWTSVLTNATDFFTDNPFIDLAIATVSFNFWVPIWRDFLLMLGFIDASYTALFSALKLKRSVGIVAGGAAEALNAHPGTCDLVLNRRKGFIRLALESGTPIVPVFAFGENEKYWQVPNPKGSLLRRLQEKALSVTKIATPIPMGATMLKFMPRRVPLLTVLGKPIAVEKQLAPSKEQIDALHATYVAQLTKLYDDHVEEYLQQLDRLGLERPNPVPRLCVAE